MCLNMFGSLGVTLEDGKFEVKTEYSIRSIRKISGPEPGRCLIVHFVQHSNRKGCKRFRYRHRGHYM